MKNIDPNFAIFTSILNSNTLSLFNFTQGNKMDDLRFETTLLPHIVTQVSTGSLVLFTGAGFSLDGFNAQGRNFPGVQKITERIWDISYPGKPYEEGNELKDLFDYALKHKRDSLENLLHEEFTAQENEQPDWYSKIMSLPWRRAYTLNIDNLMEIASEKVQPKYRKVVSISATTEKKLDALNDTNFNIIHINGDLNRSVDDLIFSRSQYTNKNNADYYDLLKNDLTQRPAIFIGSSLNEDSFWEHIISRGLKGERGNKEHRSRSYLVIPSLPTSKRTLLEEYNIEWVPMTGKEFIERIYDQVKPEIGNGFKELKLRSEQMNDYRNYFYLVPDLVKQTKSDSDYLMGAEPTWDDLLRKRVATRNCFDELSKLANSIFSTSDMTQFITLTGTAGTGKSSALKWLALKLGAEGHRVGWADEEYVYSNREFKESIENSGNLDALLIDNADLYGNRLSDLIRYVLSGNSRVLVVVEMRSSKVDGCINTMKLTNKFESIEYTVPNLTDGDIEVLIKTLDKENRLGKLKGESHENRIAAFKKHANRQLLVAMYQATSGNKFEERATEELKGLDRTSMFIYGIVAFATFYRYYLTRDEILLSYQDPDNPLLNKLATLHSRKIIHNTGFQSERYKARHRQISQMVCDELTRSGEAYGILTGLFKIGVAKVNANTKRNSREAKMLWQFCNHNFLTKRITPEKARQLYSEFEYGLAWDSHYWLHRGALELEQDNLAEAENFLNQAESLRDNDSLIKTEQAYLRFKKALAEPKSTSSFRFVEEAIEILLKVIDEDITSPHPYDILCRQGLKWIDRAELTSDKKIELLELFQAKMKTILLYEPDDDRLPNLDSLIRKALLGIAVRKSESESQ